MLHLRPTFNRFHGTVVLTAALALGGCATTTTNLENCADTTEHILGGELAAIRVTGGNPYKLNEDCLKAKQTATIVFMKNDKGDFSPYALKFGEIYHSKAEPKVRAFFDKYLAAENYTAAELGKAARLLALPVETQVAQTSSETGQKRLFVCRVDGMDRRCRYEALKASADGTAPAP